MSPTYHPALEDAVASFNKIFIIGYIGRDAKLDRSDGDFICTLPIATNERRNTTGNGSKTITTWFRICIRGGQAEYLSARLVKGMLLYVEGHLSQREYTDRQGALKTSLDVRATDIHVMIDPNEECRILPVMQSDSDLFEDDLIPL